MKDLIVKYRPKSFSELWTMGGGVQEILAFLRTETLPIGLVLHGGYGCGKTTLAQLLSASLSCLKPKDDDPCYECEGCAFADLWFMFHRGRMLISCGKDSLQQVFEFGNDLQHQSQFPLLRRRYSIVFDEAHELKPDMQARVLPLMEITPNTSFIFCTTHTDKLSGAILARSHTIRLAPLEPSVAQAALLRIAKAEGIALSSQEALDLASKGEGIPRECLKLLQLHCAKAALPPGEEFGTTRTESRFR